MENDKHLNEIWERIKDKYELVDSFKILNPKLRRYSYVKHNARSRIDCIYIPETESGKIRSTKFVTTPWDDHKIYEINVFHNIDIGLGQWAHNINLLRDETFRKTLGKKWVKFRKVKSDFSNIEDRRDAVNSCIRTIAIGYAQESQKKSYYNCRKSNLSSRI